MGKVCPDKLELGEGIADGCRGLYQEITFRFLMSQNMALSRFKRPKALGLETSMTPNLEFQR